MRPFDKGLGTPHGQLFCDATLLAQMRLQENKPAEALALCRYATLAAPNLYPLALPLLKQAAMDLDELGAIAEALAALPATPPATGTSARPWPQHPVLDLEGLAQISETIKCALPRITVVTASYNSARYIEETILSVMNQGYPNVEHILIDGGSTDETMEIVARYKDHFALIISEPDDGQADAITKGFRLGTGELATWLNSDDLLMPGALMAMAIRFAETGADLVVGIVEVFGEDMESIWHFSPYDKERLHFADLTDVDRYWMQGAFFYQPEVIYTMDLWRRAGGFIDSSITYCIDWDLWTRFGALNARIAKTKKHIARFRIHKDQKTFVPEETFFPELYKLARLYGSNIHILNGPEGALFLPGDEDDNWKQALSEERAVCDKLAKFAERFVNSGDFVLDIGPGPGLLAIHLAKMVGPNGRVHILDGNEHTAFLLKRSMAAHNLGHAETIFGFPVQKGGGALHFESSPKQHAKDDAFGFARSHLEGKAIPTVSIDPQQLGGRRLSFVHLNAAGLEPLALQGLEELLRTHRPALLIKADPKRLAQFSLDLAVLSQMLEDWNYALHPLGEECYIQAVIKRC